MGPQVEHSGVGLCTDTAHVRTGGRDSVAGEKGAGTRLLQRHILLVPDGYDLQKEGSSVMKE